MSDDELYRALGRIEGSLEAVLEKLTDQTTLNISHDTRISKLEKWQAWTLGAGAAVGVALTALWAVLTQVLHGR